MCEPGQPCPEAEEGEETMTKMEAMVKRDIAYLKDLVKRLKVVFSDEVAEELGTMAEVQMKVVRSLDQILLKVPSPKDGDIGQILEALATQMLGRRAKQSMQSSMLGLNMRAMRQVLDNFHIPDDQRLIQQDLLTEVLAADSQIDMTKWHTKGGSKEYWGPEGLFMGLLSTESLQACEMRAAHKDKAEQEAAEQAAPRATPKGLADLLAKVFAAH